MFLKTILKHISLALALLLLLSCAACATTTSPHPAVQPSITEINDIITQINESIESDATDIKTENILTATEATPQSTENQKTEANGSSPLPSADNNLKESAPDAQNPEQPTTTENENPLTPPQPPTSTPSAPTSPLAPNLPAITPTESPTQPQSSPTNTPSSPANAPSAPEQSPTSPTFPPLSPQQPSPTPTESINTPTTQSPVPTSSPTDSDPIILTIKGAGLNSETTWTLNQLKDRQEGYREKTYSTTNNWPSFGHIEAHGISIPHLLQQSGIKSSAASFKFTSTDGYNITVTHDQIFATRYTYANHTPSGSSKASAVEPIIAWEWGDANKVRPENIRPFFGQSGPMEVNSSAFVKNLCLIEVLTTPTGKWQTPDASIANNEPVASGTQLELLHENIDNIRIYYTTDGSDPTYTSPVYNPSASYFQPHLTVPIILTKTVTIKAFATGIGKDPSPIVTLKYTVQ